MAGCGSEGTETGEEEDWWTGRGSGNVAAGRDREANPDHTSSSSAPQNPAL